MRSARFKRRLLVSFVAEHRDQHLLGRAACRLRGNLWRSHAERLRLLRLLHLPGACRHGPRWWRWLRVHRVRIGMHFQHGDRPGFLSGMHASGQLLEHLRAMRNLPRQAHDSRRLPPGRRPMPCGQAGLRSTRRSGLPCWGLLSDRLLHRNRRAVADPTVEEADGLLALLNVVQASAHTASTAWIS